MTPSPHSTACARFRTSVSEAASILMIADTYKEAKDIDKAESTIRAAMQEISHQPRTPDGLRRDPFLPWPS